MSGPRRFTPPADGRLTPAMLEAWSEDGFLVLDGFYTKAECRQLQTRALEIVAAFDPGSAATVFSTTSPEHVDDRYFRESGDKIRCFLEEEAIGADGLPNRDKELAVNKIGHAMHDLDPVFSAFARKPGLAEIARALGVVEPLLLQSMYIFKQPGIGGEVTCHQDSTYLYTEPLSCLGFWTAIDAADEENGCLWVAPGGHRGPLRTRHREIDGRLVTESLDATPMPREALVSVPAEPGTLIVFDGLLPHWSAPNRSPRPRHAHTLHVIDAHARYPADNWLRRGADLLLRGF